MTPRSLPPDPFTGDPDDPTHELVALDDEDDDYEPLTPVERQELVETLSDLEAMRALLEPRGVKGIHELCDGCDEVHSLAWDLLEDRLRHLLAHDEPIVHEQAHDPDLEAYVSWDYARGYLDGATESVDAPDGPA